MLALWGVADRRLTTHSRMALVLAPVVLFLVWFLAAGWAYATGHAYGAEYRMVVTTGGDVSSSRFAVWSNTLALIAQEPWTGVGPGEFNLAWTLSAFPDRPTAFFDHSHNIVLQLMVELGVPLGTIVLALLSLSLHLAVRRAWSTPGELGVVKRTACMLVLLVGLHSLLEYPLWYAYFLLPAAFAWGIALFRTRADIIDVEPQESTVRSTRLLWTAAGTAMVLGACAAALDYWHVAAIYDPPENAAPLEDRIVRGQRSPLFGHHADYAAATAFGPPNAPLSPSQELAFRRAPHQLLDVRLMIAWSQALAAQGDLDKARWLAARIREFRNPGADEYFAPCQEPAQAAQAFQCQPPTREVHWREFTRR
ncbi:MAG TPA: Wzy polymerase domain-containing protein [Burkholderiaceae bacterium]